MQELRFCPTHGCVLLDFHIGPHSNAACLSSQTRGQRQRQRGQHQRQRGQQQQAQRVSSRTKKPSLKASSRDVVVAEVVSSDDDATEVNAQQVPVEHEEDQDELGLLGSCVRVWWPGMQTWYIGDVIAYRSGSIAKTSTQHFIPYNAHLVRYIDGDERWHGFWEETLIVVSTSSSFAATTKFCIMCRAVLDAGTPRCTECNEVQG